MLVAFKVLSYIYPMLYSQRLLALGRLKGRSCSEASWSMPPTFGRSIEETLRGVNSVNWTKSQIQRPHFAQFCYACMNEVS